MISKKPLVTQHCSTCPRDPVKCQGFFMLNENITVAPTALDNGFVMTMGKIIHYNDVIMISMASQITSVSIVYSTVCSRADQRNHQSSAKLAFVRENHRWPVTSPYKEPVTRKIFPFDDVIMLISITHQYVNISQKSIKVIPSWNLFEINRHQYHNLISYATWLSVTLLIPSAEN